MSKNFVQKQGVFLNNAKPQTPEQVAFTKHHIFSTYNMDTITAQFVNKIEHLKQVQKGEEVLTVIEVQIKGFVAKDSEGKLRYISYSATKGYKVL